MERLGGETRWKDLLAKLDGKAGWLSCWKDWLEELGGETR